MKTQIALISSALMASGAALAGSGSVDTETSFETEQRSYESSTSDRQAMPGLFVGVC